MFLVTNENMGLCLYIYGFKRTFLVFMLYYFELDYLWRLWMNEWRKISFDLEPLSLSLSRFCHTHTLIFSLSFYFLLYTPFLSFFNFNFLSFFLSLFISFSLSLFLCFFVSFFVCFFLSFSKSAINCAFRDRFVESVPERSRSKARI